MSSLPTPETSKWPFGTKLVTSIAAGCGVLIGAALLAVLWLDRNHPAPLEIAEDYSVEVLDRQDQHLRIFINGAGRLRLKTKLKQVDPTFLEMLIAYEDKRFFQHNGVDPLALIRAVGQFVGSGKVVSGGSTITMQLARLIEPRKQRSLSAKLWQMFRALQIERQLSKPEILQRYVTLAPYGGNIEGVRAASLSWFGKEPVKLSLREAALLVALPQSPESRRPDRWPDRAKVARDRVLERLAASGFLAGSEAKRVAGLALSAKRRPIARLAPHLSQLARDRNPTALVHRTLLDSGLQRKMETLAGQSAIAIAPRVSVAIVVADSISGDILASVGSPDVDSSTRKGWVDMTQAARSPGSTLKPFVYGLAIEDGLVRPASMISDRPTDFDGYRPTNFDLTYQGDISIRRALQMSLNVPAVKLMDAVGPARLVSRMKRVGITPRLNNNAKPGLGLVLGGASLSLTELVQLYANLVNGTGRPIALGDGIRAKPGPLNGRPILSPIAAWHIKDILVGVRPPTGSNPISIGYKTGTSYGHRDAWSVGFDGRHIIGVWVGRADNGPVPGITGMKTAAPILFKAFSRSEIELERFPPAPAGALREDISELPTPLRKFQEKYRGAQFSNIHHDDKLEIAFPSHGDELEIAKFSDGSHSPVVIKLQGGVPPYRLLENDAPLPQLYRQRKLFWSPTSRGTSRLSVVDSLGQTRALDVIIR